jgi:kynureninase
MPKDARSRLTELLENEWGRLGVEGWNAGWIDLPSRLGAKIASLIGADPDEVIVCDSTTVDFFKLVSAALRMSGRKVVVTDDATFPSNGYVLQGCVERSALRVVTSADGISNPESAVIDSLDETVALLTLNHATFKSGWLYGIDILTKAAHERGALVLWDLCHSVGVVPIDLKRAGADLAVGCTYKYLNGGPGAPAFMYVRRDLQERMTSPIQGWFGQANAFSFEMPYAPAPGIRRFMAGTPPILSMAAIEAGLDLTLEAGLTAIRSKSIALTEFAIRLWEDRLAPLGITLNSPRDPEKRGGHVSFGHPDAFAIDRALIEHMRVVPDFRTPDNIRYGFGPLYNTFDDVYEGVERMRRVVAEGTFGGIDPGDRKVT